MQPLSRLNKTGLVLAGLLGVSDIVALGFPTPDGQVGPPFFILVVDAVLGVTTLGGVTWALLRRHRGAVRIVAAARIVSAITALPAFFVGPPPWLLFTAAAYVLLTVAVIVMMLTPPRRSVTVSD